MKIQIINGVLQARAQSIEDIKTILGWKVVTRTSYKKACPKCGKKFKRVAHHIAMSHK